MRQLEMFADARYADTVASPICFYDKPCPRQGRAVLGPEAISANGHCVNRSITCVTCGSTGEKSTNLKMKGKS